MQKLIQIFARVKNLVYAIVRIKATSILFACLHRCVNEPDSNEKMLAAVRTRVGTYGLFVYRRAKLSASDDT